MDAAGGLRGGLRRQRCPSTGYGSRRGWTTTIPARGSGGRPLRRAADGQRREPGSCRRRVHGGAVSRGRRGSCGSRRAAVDLVSSASVRTAMPPSFGVPGLLERRLPLLQRVHALLDPRLAGGGRAAAQHTDLGEAAVGRQPRADRDLLAPDVLHRLGPADLGVRHRHVDGQRAVVRARLALVGAPGELARAATTTPGSDASARSQLGVSRPAWMPSALGLRAQEALAALLAERDRPPCLRPCAASSRQGTRRPWRGRSRRGRCRLRSAAAQAGRRRANQDRRRATSEPAAEKSHI